AIGDRAQAGDYLSAVRRANSKDRRESVLDIPPAGYEVDSVRAEEPLWKAQTRDVMHASLPLLLRYEDRNSMAHSIESRLPFMDYRVVEMGIALPAALKLRNGFGKWTIREAMKGQVPEAI